MAPSSSELWAHQMMPSSVVVDCLLPNGVLVQLPCSRDSTLGQVKAHLWREARKYPAFGKLLSPELYIFISITQDAEKEEFYDEARRLCDLRLFQPILKLVEPEGNKEEKMLNYEISMAIGMSVNEFNENSDIEVRSFRRDILAICEQSVKERDKHGAKSLAQYYYPPDIDADADLPQHIQKKLIPTDFVLIVCVWVMSGLESKEKITVKIKYRDRPDDVVAEAIRRRTHSKQLSVEEQKQAVSLHKDSYLLKICGIRQYLIGSHPLCQYRYIRDCIVQSRVPQLLLIKRSDFENDLPRTTFLQPSFLRTVVSKHRLELNHHNQQSISIWEVKSPFRVKINSATFVNVREAGKIFVKAGIYLGTEPLGLDQQTRLVDSSNPLWNQWLEFTIAIPNLPRYARLCLALCCSVTKKKRVTYPIAWGNVNLFDFKNNLMSGKISLNLWPVPQGFDDLLNPIGCPIVNPNKDSSCLEVEIFDYDAPIMYPSHEEFLQYAHQLSFSEFRHYEELPDRIIDVEDEIKNLDEIVKRDVLAEISEQEKELLWRRRHDCIKKPDSLPKLLRAVKWNRVDDVAMLYALLKDWPVLSVTAAMELLDCTYLDQVVREFSVKSLEIGLSDDKLSQYLLQLVQSLKVEPYLDNALTRFLLRRALLNRKIGHFLFWHLKSEIYHVNIKMRFSLILEAYCRGCGPYLKEVNRQVESLEKLTKITDAIKLEEDKYKAFCEYMEQPDFMEALQNYTSPLDSSVVVGQLLVEESRVKHSKKSPLSLCWKNPDPSADCQSDELLHHRIIFKNGDDLRQDMLTLQVISIMERIWQSEGLDLRMTPYGCLSTGKEVGLIEEVRNCKTVMQIQRKMGTVAAMQLDNTQLYKWLKDNNPGDSFDAACETFFRSCAGYCVATFVLGIGDRHPDNIMVTKHGHVFHIDFGHFLDHRKKKFGIQRERVPFILTDDFIYVIGGIGKNPRKSTRFIDFMELCGRAYITLRKHANIFITLFSMMMGCGIPELQSTDDIEYLRKTLAVDKNDLEALKYFQQQFHAAYGGAWTTRVDWFFHFIKNK